MVGASCLDCGLDYEKFYGDLIVPDKIWLGWGLRKHGDLVCPACICCRLKGFSKILLGFNPGQEIGVIVNSYTSSGHAPTKGVLGSGPRDC